MNDIHRNESRKPKPDKIARIEAIIKEYGIESVEQLWQSDRLTVAAVEILEKICDIVGYADPE